MIYERQRCPSCGTHPSDWRDEKGQHKEPQPYHAVGFQCLGCEALQEERDRLPKKSAGWHVHLEVGPRPED